MFSGRQILKNTLLLTAAALLLRFASMLFQAHLAGRIGAEGLGAVQLLLSVSAFATTLGLAGMRVAASCLCAQAHGRREPAQVQLAAAHCLGFVLVTSTLAAAGLYWAAPVLAGRVLHEPAAVGSLRLLAGLLPAGCAGLVLGGYLTAVGKVWQLTAIDAGERVLGLGLSLLLLRFAPQADQVPPHFACSCSRERVGKMIRGLGQEEAIGIVAERGDVEVGCEFCGKQYHFDSVDVAQLFAAGQTATPDGQLH